MEVYIVNPRCVSVLIAVLLFPVVQASAAPGTAARPVPAGRMLSQGPLEKDFAELEANIPGFAGWYLDKEGTAIVSLKDVGRRDEALAHVGRILDARRAKTGEPRAKLEVREAKYSFLELAAFRDAVKQNFPAGVQRVDVNEVRNVLALGVAAPEDLGRVRAAVAKLGVPPDAVTVDIVERPTSRLNLWDYQRPLRGGNSLVYKSSGHCTIGVNGYYGSSSNVGFITASHCTSVPWSYSGNTAYQHSWMYYAMAVEYEDPDPMAHALNPYCPNPAGGGWPANMVCRWSDSAFYYYTDSSANGGANIQSTTYVDGGSAGSVEINGYLPVTGDAPYSVSGTLVNKMGATSGWTNSTVVETCVDTWQQFDTPYGEPVFLLCQDTSGLFAEPGDSGAPVYRKFSTYTQWVGILWGEDNWVTYHSPSWNVRQDLSGFSY